MRQIIVATIVMLWGNSVAAQLPGVASQVLATTASRGLSVPAFESTHPAQCDSSGNLYFQLSSGGDRVDGDYLMRLAVATETPTIFAVPKGLADRHQAWMNFSVSRSGKVWVLDEDGDGQIHVLGYDEGGRVASQIELQTPAQLEPRDLFVFDSGAVFLSGYFGAQSSDAVKGKTYAAVFEQTGKLRKEVDAESGLPIDLKELKAKPLDGAGTIGSDQLLYYARSNHVSVIREDGVVVRQFSLTKPTNVDVVASINISDGLLSIDYLGMTSSHKLVSQLLVLDGETGRPVGLYIPATEQGNNVVCFSQHEGYTFFRIEKGKVKLLSASLP